MNIPLGSIVRDKVTGFVGIAENRATFMYGCDRYCVQPRIDSDGKIPDSRMVDEPQLEIIEDGKRVMDQLSIPEELVELGQLVYDPVRGAGGYCYRKGGIPKRMLKGACRPKTNAWSKRGR